MLHRIKKCRIRKFQIKVPICSFNLKKKKMEKGKKEEI